MPGNPFYNSPFWKRLRAQALERDGYQCTVPGCGHVATFADHKVTRPPNRTTPCELDCLDNLRSLCARHDAQVKEQGGVRKSGGRFRVRGCDVDGWPFDPRRR